MTFSRPESWEVNSDHIHSLNRSSTWGQEDSFKPLLILLYERILSTFDISDKFDG